MLYNDSLDNKVALVRSSAGRSARRGPGYATIIKGIKGFSGNPNDGIFEGIIMELRGLWNNHHLTSSFWRPAIKFIKAGYIFPGRWNHDGSSCDVKSLRIRLYVLKGLGPLHSYSFRMGLEPPKILFLGNSRCLKDPFRDPSNSTETCAFLHPYRHPGPPAEKVRWAAKIYPKQLPFSEDIWMCIRGFYNFLYISLIFLAQLS